MPELSIIIIGRNEEARIGRCLRSVFVALEGMRNYEVIYVDSASEDNTVQIAEHFPISILQLKPQWNLSPSAGRYIGFQYARGDFLMFIDGDSLLYKQWLKQAISYLAGHGSRGGVAGIVHEMIQNSNNKCTAVVKDRYQQAGAGPTQEAMSLGGIAMYRRKAMQEAGTFNPYLKAGEEGEVALRLRKAGYSITRLNQPMCLTYAPTRESFAEIFRRSRSRLFDFGPSLRYCMENRTAMRYLREELWFMCTYIASLVFVLSVVVGAVIAEKSWWLLLASVPAICLLLLKVPPKRLAVSILKRTIITYRTMMSFAVWRTMPVDSYPTDVVVVK